MTTNKDWVLDLANGVKILNEAPPEIRDHRDAVLAAISRDRGKSLMRASDRLKDDKEVVLEALRNGASLELASLRLRQDSDCKATATKFEWIWNVLGAISLHLAPEELRDDVDVVKAAVRKYGTNLAAASDRLQDDIDVVTCAVRTYGGALKYASERLRDELSVVQVAVRQSRDALPFVSLRLKTDKELMLVAVERSEDAMHFVSESLLNDPDFISRVLGLHGGLALRFASDRVRRDAEVAKIAVRSDYAAMSYVLPPARDDPGVQSEADASLQIVGKASSAMQPMLVSKARHTRLEHCDPSCWPNDIEQRIQWLQRKDKIGPLSQYAPHDPWQTCQGFCGRGGKKGASSFSGPEDMLCPCRGQHPREKQAGSCGTNVEWLDMDTGKPLEGPTEAQVCWRYAFRWHLGLAKANAGCVLQLMEPLQGRELSDSQLLEEEMAHVAGVPVFRICDCDGDGGVPSQVSKLANDIYGGLSIS